jgi:two-component system, chemotaxis family, chemotaxis protein CheY
MVTASSGEHAVDLLQSGQMVHVVFTDIQLAGVLSGWDVAEAGRASQAELPVIYTSGNLSDRSRSVEHSLFFSKPYDIEKVIEACEGLRSK